jgi:multidrug efflux pump subunit AcrA (membrane-fusion protein)
MGKEAHEREEQRRRERKEREEQERIARQQKAEAEAEQARKAEEEAANLLAEQKRKDLERLQAELDAAALISPPPPPPPTTSPRDKLRFFGRKRAETKTSPPATAERESTSVSLSTTRSNEPPQGIEQGGGGIVPQIDAPISASNAGERVSLCL